MLTFLQMIAILAKEHSEMTLKGLQKTFYDHLEGNKSSANYQIYFVAVF